MKNKTKLIDGYLNDIKKVIDTFPVDDLERILTQIEDAREKGNIIFTCGNGGSAATANHMVCDFSKNTRKPTKKPLKVIGLSDNIPMLLAYANDEGYETVFEKQLETLAQINDVLIAISGSGNSPNVLNAVEKAKEMGVITIGLTGIGGGKLSQISDFSLVVPSNSMEMVEDFHMIIDHLLTICLRED
jgi:D-sedoheptulose 7-phosphate isomerase